jgi:RNA polymerase sigma-70 factor (sigma-E family)
MTTGGRWGGSERVDELLSGLYQQVTTQQAARYAASYDIPAGLERYQAWLREHAAGERATAEVIQAIAVVTLRASASGIGVMPAGPAFDEVVVAGRSRERSASRGRGPEVRAGWDADRAVTALYAAHYRSLVRLAAMLVQDISVAEEVVQDSFVALHSGWARLANADRALSYLRQSVVNRSRSVLRHRAGGEKVTPKLASDLAGGEQEDTGQPERSALMSALRTLPGRQREALVLRFYADMSEAQIADAMQISRGAVKSHTARAISSLQARLRSADD